MSERCFLLVGNAPYRNRGCEAIVRGTTRILGAAFGESVYYKAASFGPASEIRLQSVNDSGRRVTHEPLIPKSRASLDYLKAQAHRFLGVSSVYCSHTFPFDAADSAAALQVGGDNYTLDYGYPRQFMAIDRWLGRRGIPLVLWGASVGPFGSDPLFEQEIAAHLAKFRLITARESRSARYLKRLSVTNVVQVADPAFLMESESVGDLELPETFFGVNLSPLAARNVTKGKMESWRSICADALRALLARSELPVVLIPHVTSERVENNDHGFLLSLAEILRQPGRITVVGGNYNAAELKWIIAQAACFAGVRTHSTIAALSSGVPTLSLGYSLKAWGINEDVFGHTAFCADVKSLAQPDAFAKRMMNLLEQRSEIRRHLLASLPDIQRKAMSAGLELRRVLESRN